jgi:hypothetical protein
MGLRNFHPATKTVNDVTVRGVSVTDMAVLTQAYGPTMINMFRLATEQDSTDPAAFGNVIAAAAVEAPQLVSVFIQLLIVDDDPERLSMEKELALITQMTIGMQTELIEAIFTNTFESDVDIKKMVEAIARMFDKISTAIEQVPRPATENTTLVSDAK